MRRACCPEQSPGAVTSNKRDALLNFAFDIRFAPLRQLRCGGFKSIYPLIATGFQRFNLPTSAETVLRGQRDASDIGELLARTGIAHPGEIHQTGVRHLYLTKLVRHLRVGTVMESADQRLKQHASVVD